MCLQFKSKLPPPLLETGLKLNDVFDQHLAFCVKEGIMFPEFAREYFKGMFQSVEAISDQNPSSKAAYVEAIKIVLPQFGAAFISGMTGPP